MHIRRCDFDYDNSVVFAVAVAAVEVGTAGTADTGSEHLHSGHLLLSPTSTSSALQLQSPSQSPLTSAPAPVRSRSPISLSSLPTFPI